jgi:SAM-dependent methyltransferase
LSVLLCEEIFPREGIGIEMSIMYRSPRIYNAFVKLVHGDSLEQRFLIISEEIGESKNVLDLGCGTALLNSYLETGSEYEGWDLNDKFVSYCQKMHLNVHKKNVFDVGERKHQWDVIVMCDLLHHVVPNHEKLLTMAIESARKVIVSEPARSFKPPPFLKPIDYVISTLIADNDGINAYRDLKTWDFDNGKLEALFQRFGSRKVWQVGRDLVAVFGEP